MATQNMTAGRAKGGIFEGRLSAANKEDDRKWPHNGQRPAESRKKRKKWDIGHKLAHNAGKGER